MSLVRGKLPHALIVLGCAAIGLVAARAPQSQTTAEIMAEKMELAQQLLAVIVLQDFEAIEDTGTELDYLAEFQSWFVLPTPEYAQHSDEFREAAQRVVKAGEEEDVEAALAAHASMVEKCVRCHQYMKSVRRADEPR